MPFQHASLFEVHGALSALCHAVSKTLEPLCVEVKAHWQSGIYLSVSIECRSKHKQIVIDRLMQGALVDNYDYRFKLSYSTMLENPEEWVIVTAYPDIHHDHARKNPKAKEAA